MQNRTHNFLFSLLAVLFLTNSIIFAAGQIKGKVTDSQNGDELPGANIILVGTALGSSTDIEGNYRIVNIPAGEYEVKASFIGYNSKTTTVTIVDNRTLELDFQLSYGGLESDTVVVTAQAKGQMQAINQQLSSMKITNVVAKDRIQEVPDANAAESVGRLPGVSIKRSSGEGNEVVIRGLQPRLNLITVNNIRLPSTNEYNNAVGLAGISQYMLDGIEVRKSLTAEDDADVVGGIVDLKLATAPEGFHGNAIIDGMYNDLTQDFGSFRATIQGSNRFFDDQLGVIAQLNMEKADRTRERYSANYNKDERTTVNEGVFLTGGNFQLHEIERNRFSASIVADYKLPKGKIQFNSIYNKFNEDRWERDLNYSVAASNVRVNKYSNSIDMDNYSIINGLNIETELFDRAFLDIGASLTHGNREEPDNNRMRLIYDVSASSPIDPEFVENTFGKKGYDVISHIRDMKDEYDLDGVMKSMTEFEETEMSLQANLKIPFNLFKNVSAFAKVGGKMRFKDRDYNFDENGGFGFYGGGDPVRTDILKEYPDLDWPFTWQTRPQGAALPAYPVYDNWHQAILDDRIDLSGFAARGYVDGIADALENSGWGNISTYLVSAADLANDYSGDERLYAGYIMTEFNYDEWISLNVGLRYEDEETNYGGYGVIDIASSNDILDTLDAVKRTNSFLLPSATLRVNYTDWADVRLAYSKSLARPEYYSFIPHYSTDIRLSLSSPAGNPNLKPAVSENFDLILSFYSNNIGLFTVSGFYKKINDFFYNRSYKVIDEVEDNSVHNYEGVVVPKGQYINIWYNNPEESTVKGLEFDWQTHFWYLPEPFNGLILGINYTTIASESHYYVSDVEKIKYGTKPWEFTEVRIDSFESRRLIDQPKNSFNVSLGYDYKDLSIRLAYYFQGSTLVGKGDKKENDTYAQNYNRLDFSLRQKLPIKGLSVQLLWNNITGVPDEQYRWIESFNTFEEYYGSTGTLGLKYEF